jgi:outer membrane protein assembly factor BamB
MRILIPIVTFATLATASDWPRYRGPNGSGVSPDRNLPAEIGKDRNVVWSAKIPSGNASPVVIGGKLYLAAAEGDERVLLCLDAATGKQIWRRAVPKAHTETPHPINGSATPTPATDGRALFVFFPEFGLIAWDFDGKELWRVELGPFGAIQGMAVSPVYAEGSVILLVDTPEQAYLAAFDARSGKQVWKVERPIGFMGSYATPSLFTPAGGPAQIVVSGAVELTGYQARTGERLWWAKGVTAAPAALPLIAGDSVYTVEPADAAPPPFEQMLKAHDKDNNGRIELTEVAGEGVNDRIMSRIFRSIDKNVGDNDGVVTEAEFKRFFSPETFTGGGLVRTRLNGKGDVSKTHVGWRHLKGLPYVTAPLLYENVIYSVRNGGILSTFDPETGKLLGEARLKNAIGDYYASPVAGDGKIYFVNYDGKVTILRAGAEWSELSSADLGERVIATPAIADGRLYIRTAETMYCFAAPKSSN